ncbi:MAG: thioredoxin [Candidatus Bathyarchaeota archaeon]|jgi:thioredoxin 1|nr:thioredoxin [Candidatus Bathyarchaeota archaeon]MDD4325766.1 thioredoxin [Candidatus Bathyarchaeota archaeon]MDI9576665.1 thioredoxin [Thermoproteota archaeon]MDT8781716.1 thioredoxin [Candidatus Bathyarchaeota archaeon]NLD67050.1 thioredoxin [Thermoproteota archaeon]
MSEDKELERIRMKKIEDLKKSSQEKEQLINQPIILTDENFSATLTANDLLVVDFWAPWCAPCRMVGPIIEQLSKEYAGKVTFAKMNVDENQRVPSNYGIMSIPTIIVMQKGKIVETIVGAYPKSHIEATFKKYIK